MKTVFFGMLMLISGISFGQSLINNSSCDLWLRSTGYSAPLGPACIPVGATINLTGTDAWVVHYRCPNGCGPGAFFGSIGNCQGYLQNTSVTTGSCCTSGTLTINYNTMTGNFTAT